MHGISVGGIRWIYKVQDNFLDQYVKESMWGNGCFRTYFVKWDKVNWQPCGQVSFGEECSW